MINKLSITKARTHMLNHTYVLLFLFDYQPEVLLFFTFSTGEITFSLPQLSIIGQCIGINRP